MNSIIDRLIDYDYSYHYNDSQRPYVNIALGFTDVEQIDKSIYLHARLHELTDETERRILNRIIVYITIDYILSMERHPDTIISLIIDIINQEYKRRKSMIHDDEVVECILTHPLYATVISEGWRHLYTSVYCVLLPNRMDFIYSLEEFLGCHIDIVPTIFSYIYENEINIKNNTENTDLIDRGSVSDSEIQSPELMDSDGFESDPGIITF